MTKRVTTMMLALLMTGATAVYGQTAAKTTAAKKPVAKKEAKPTEAETQMMQQLQDLKQMVQAQQTQIDALRQQNAAKDAQISSEQTATQQAAQQAQTAAQAAEAASSSSSSTAAAVSDLKTAVAAQADTNANLVQAISDTKSQLSEQIQSPVAIHYKGVTITPVGYFAAESVYRTRAINSDINTPFNSTPYMNSGQAYTSEFNGSGRQSRVGMRVQSTVPFGKLNGFLEADFLGTGITSNANQSNSYVLRQRQFWGQVAMNNGFTFTGGQMWSLVTETKHAMDASTENLPQEIDAQYHVGFSWTRQYGARFVQSFAGGKANIGVSAEEAQITNYTSQTTPPDFFVGAIGTNGGLYNLSNKYTNNPLPDVVVKAAFDPGFGHWEIGGVARWFRSRIYPNQTSNATAANTTGGYNDTVTGGGAFVNARFPVSKYLDVGLHMMGGDGINRYGTSQLADVTVHSTGVLEPLRGYQGLLSLEAHPTKKLDLVGYAGSEYAQRTYYNVGGTIYGYAPPQINTSSCFVEQGTVAPPAQTGTTTGNANTGTVFGGAPYDPSSSCGAQTRVITEGTAGFIYRFFSGPQLGRIQYWMTYNYLTKTAWVGTAGAPKATNNMIFTSFRYYIP